MYSSIWSSVSNPDAAEDNENSSVTPEMLRDKADVSKLTNGRSTVHSNQSRKMKEQQIEARMTELSGEVPEEASELYFGDKKKKAEDVINKILNQLTQQRQSATIKITTHKKVSPPHHHIHQHSRPRDFPTESSPQYSGRVDKILKIREELQPSSKLSIKRLK